MALNKILEGMLKKFKKDYLLEDLDTPKAFEHFVNYLIVSKYQPDAFNDRGDLDSIVVDQKSQFGLDAIAFIVNGNLVFGKDDIATYAKSKKLDVNIIFIQTKTEEKCDSGDLLKLIQATKNFLTNFEAITERNETIINAKEIYDELFKYENYKLCTSQSPSCHIYYVTAAKDWDKQLITDICNTNKQDIRNTVNDIRDVDIQIFGSEYLMSAYNETQNNVSVRVNLRNCITLERIEGIKEAYIGYLTGNDYLKIICDDNDDLRRRIFYENVRDYQGIENKVNKEIRNTIQTPQIRGQFVLLNNGVTIITKSVTALGAGEFELSNFQIVNGCQTSNEIYNCREYAHNIFVPVKIIYTTDMDIISSIVKATNRQTPVPEEAFIALSQYHKKLQLLFSAYSKEMPIEIFYERRSGEEHDIKEYKGKYQIVSLHGMVRAFESVYFQNPSVVYRKNPANILMGHKENIFHKNHKPETYYIASYLFTQFVHLQQKGIFNRHDYVLRFYVIMLVRILILQNIEVPKFDSSAMSKENNKIIDTLKNGVDDYFIQAKQMLETLLNREEYKNKRRYDILRTQEFCQKVKDYVKESLQNK